MMKIVLKEHQILLMNFDDSSYIQTTKDHGLEGLLRFDEFPTKKKPPSEKFKRIVERLYLLLKEEDSSKVEKEISQTLKI
mmetsp:Transcript_8547/g.7572  ORF Transcript_8547/g.7572 Transcript_8547/m.7572 type:complete len:80 (+) Transcript_8547:1268-1507(+)